MLRNYLLAAVRFIKRNRLYAGINIIGLSISLTFCLMILIYVGGALGWDKMHPANDQTYIISPQYYMADDVSDEFGLFDFGQKEVVRHSGISYVHAKGIAGAFPEIEAHTIIFSVGTDGRRKVNLEVENGELFEETVTSVEGAFFDLFNFKAISGNPTLAIEQPKSLVLSQKLAERYFGKSDAVGQSINLVLEGKPTSFVVGAVVEIPEKSSVDFGILINIKADKRLEGSDFTSQSRAQYSFFARLTANLDLDSFEAKVNTYFEDNFSDFIQNQRRFSEIRADSKLLEIKATKLSSIHLSRILSWHNKADYQSILLTSLFVLILIVISGINYLLISLAMLSKRVSSVSIRRVVGARGKSILTQFWLENIATTSLALILALCFAQYLLPYVENWIHGDLTWSVDKLIVYAFYLFIILVIISFLVSLYPAKLISGFRLTDSLKNSNTYKANTSFMNFLITAQFIICFGLIASGLVMGSQIDYILNKNLGFDKEQVIKINTGDKLLAQKLETLAEVQSVGRGGAWQFGHGQMGFRENIEGRPYTLTQLESERKLLDLLDLDIEWLVEDFGQAPVAIVNSDLADLLGRDSLLNVEIGFNQRVVGILHNTYLLPLTEQEELYFINPNSEDQRLWETYIKFKPNLMNQGIAKVSEIWSEFYPNTFFKYVFLDEYVAENYDEFQSSSGLINVTTFLAVVIACLGLFALNGIVVNNRMKEFGIRKVLGATMNHIILLVNSRIITIYLISLTLALPLSYYLMQEWSSKFRFQSGGVNQKLVLTAFIGLLLMVLTVSLHSIKSSRVNPVDLLKDE